MTTRQKLAAAALAGMIRYADTNRGAVKQIADEMTRLGNEKFARQMVGQWLNVDAARRIEPKLGAWLLLCRAFNNVKKRSERT